MSPVPRFQTGDLICRVLQNLFGNGLGESPLISIHVVLGELQASAVRVQLSASCLRLMNSAGNPPDLAQPSARRPNAAWRLLMLINRTSKSPRLTNCVSSAKTCVMIPDACAATGRLNCR